MARRMLLLALAMAVGCTSPRARSEADSDEAQERGLGELTEEQGEPSTTTDPLLKFLIGDGFAVEPLGGDQVRISTGDSGVDVGAELALVRDETKIVGWIIVTSVSEGHAIADVHPNAPAPRSGDRAYRVLSSDFG